jgi:hypothetical protein
MSQEHQDRELGMRRLITRRDFLNGVAVGIGALGYASLPKPSDGQAALQKNTDVNPPADTHEAYDLIVLGAGISGLAAAYFYRKQAGKNPRILIIDNHDDFGGHARRHWRIQFPCSPQEPMVLFMLRTPCKPGLPRRDQYRMGRFELIGTPFSTFERNIRQQLKSDALAGGIRCRLRHCRDHGKSMGTRVCL